MDSNNKATYMQVQKVSENLMKPLIAVFGDVPVPSGANEDAVKKRWIMSYKDFKADDLKKLSESLISSYDRFPSLHKGLERASELKLTRMAHSSNKWHLSNNEDHDNRCKIRKHIKIGFDFINRFPPDEREQITDYAINFYFEKSPNGSRIKSSLEETKRNGGIDCNNLLRSGVFQFLSEHGLLEEFYQAYSGNGAYIPTESSCRL